MNNSTNTGNYAWNTQQNESKYHDSFNYQNYEDIWPSLAVFSPELGTEAPQQAREPCETVFVKLSCKWVKIPFFLCFKPNTYGCGSNTVSAQYVTQLWSKMVGCKLLNLNSGPKRT